MLKYVEFINEASVYEMKVGFWVQFNGNVRNAVTPVKGKLAKIIKKSWGQKNREFTLQFEKPIVVKKNTPDGEIIEESDILVITSAQIRTLVIIPPEFIDEFKAGSNLPYIATNDFNDILKEIKFHIYNTKFLDVSYFDVKVDSDEMISFLPSSKMSALKESGEDPYKSKFRQSAKIGKIFRKLNKKLTDADVEKLVTDYRATWKLIFRPGDVNIQVVTGDKIPYWYNCDRYVSGNGTLNSSCMRYNDPTIQKRVSFYAKYPDKISLAILLDENNKLLARALIWKLDKPEGVIFMDRIYFVRTHHSKILEHYAEKNNIKTKISGYNLGKILEVELPYNEGDPIPFLDTLKWNKYKKIFTNN